MKIVQSSRGSLRHLLMLPSYHEAVFFQFWGQGPCYELQYRFFNANMPNPWVTHVTLRRIIKIPGMPRKLKNILFFPEFWCILLWSSSHVSKQEHPKTNWPRHLWSPAVLWCDHLSQSDDGRNHRGSRQCVDAAVEAIDDDESVAETLRALDESPGPSGCCYALRFPFVLQKLPWLFWLWYIVFMKEIDLCMFFLKEKGGKMNRLLDGECFMLCLFSLVWSLDVVVLCFFGDDQTTCTIGLHRL